MPAAGKFTPEVAPLFSREELVEQWQEAHKQLGIVQAELNDATKRHQACLVAHIAATDALRNQGVDVTELVDAIDHEAISKQIA